ncbi:EF-hand calcium-binding domain-containing protein 1 [Paragonimus heterotremus]|uniref:EF-hand calcium-binding domain-containing protein 1 n=1 Tax=Paragonimus heterotremus TaxID=100268 RepID=A0A8J4SLR3_9TREM|nr:EF-hand calcium-binding domain-containing protein 1 [Paragonimus heterotremus]
MLEVSIKKRIAELVTKLENQVKFTRNEREHLLDMFVKIGGKRSFAKLDRLKFREILHHTFHMTDDLLLDRVFRAFDYNSDGGITAKKWVVGLSIFLRGSLQERAAFTFRAYDLNSDGLISREEMFQLLKSSLIKILPNSRKHFGLQQPTDEDPDEGIRDLVDLVMKRLDMDHDGRVTYPDFQSAVQQDAMLLEILGPCFPEEQVAVAFLSTFQEIQLPNSICFIRPNNPAVTTKMG